MNRLLRHMLLMIACLGALAGPSLAQEGPTPTPPNRANIELVGVHYDPQAETPLIVLVTGLLPDSCTNAGEHSVRMDGDTIVIDLRTTRADPFLVCTYVVRPFTEEIPLDLDALDLIPGEYTVSVNGVTAQFTLADDGMVETPPGIGVCPIVSESTRRHISGDDGYCFLFPAEYLVYETRPGVMHVRLPVGADPSQAGVDLLEISAEERPDLDLDALADDLRDQDDSFVITETTIADAPALLVEGRPAPAGRSAFIAFGDRLIALADNHEDPAALWDVVIDSLRFFQPSDLVDPGLAGDRPVVQRNLGLVKQVPALNLAVLLDEGWDIAPTTDGAYALIAPDDARPLRFERLPGAADPGAALTDRYGAVDVEETRLNRTDGARALGVDGLCQAIALPLSDGVLLVEVAEAVCDSDGSITDSTVDLILRSVIITP
ncbi:MAG: hypothetical protein ACOCXZ_04255 [Chloroflexota bacterium]